MFGDGALVTDAMRFTVRDVFAKVVNDVVAVRENAKDFLGHVALRAEAEVEYDSTAAANAVARLHQ